ncbi:hypothetical protein JCM8208_003935 [Rhodotorula glutinis]
MSLSATVRTLLTGAFDQPRRSPRNHASSSATTTNRAAAIASMDLEPEATAAAITPEAAATEITHPDLVASQHGPKNADSVAYFEEWLGESIPDRRASTSKRTLESSTDDELADRKIFSSSTKRTKTAKALELDSTLANDTATSADRRRRNLKKQVAERNKNADSRTLRSTRKKTTTTIANIPTITLDDDTPEPEPSSSSSVSAPSSESECSSKSAYSTDATSEDEEMPPSSKKNVVALARESRKKLMAAKRSVVVKHQKARKSQGQVSTSLSSHQKAKAVATAASRFDPSELADSMLGPYPGWSGPCEVGVVKRTLERLDTALSVEIVTKDGVITDGSINTHGSTADPTDSASFLMDRAAEYGMSPTAMRQAALALAARQSAPRFTEVGHGESA